MEALPIRRLCRILVGLALGLPLLPALTGMPLLYGSHCGNGPRFGEPEYGALSLALLLLAAVGFAATQRSLPMRLRRRTLPSAFATGLLLMVVLSLVGSR